MCLRYCSESNFRDKQDMLLCRESSCASDPRAKGGGFRKMLGVTHISHPKQHMVNSPLRTVMPTTQ